MRVNLTHNDNIKTFDDVARHVELEEDRLLVEKPVQKAFMIENNREEHNALDATKAKIRVLKENEEIKPVIVDKSASMVIALVRKARTQITLIVVNLVILLVIALSQCLTTIVPLTFILVIA